MPQPMIRITARGAFAVVSRERGDVTPKGRKTRGVLAMLALTPGHRHDRTWLTEHLWSDRGRAQAAGSLRQALAEIRTLWGPEAAILLGDRKPWVGLDPASVEVDRSGAGALLEGMGVHDPRFQDWLDRQREADGVGAQPRRAAATATAAARPDPSREPAPAPVSVPDPARITIRCAPARDGSSASVLGTIVAQQIGEGITEQVSARRIAQGEDGLGIDIDVRCDVVETGDESLAMVSITHAPTGEELYSRRHRIDGPAAMLIANDGMQRTAQEAIEIAVGRLPQVLGVDRPVMRATALGRLALLRMFTYDAPAVAEADRLLGQAFETSANGVFQAWRGFLQMARWVDLGRPEAGELSRAAEECIRRAEQSAAGNALTQGLVAYTRIMLPGDARAALPAAARAAEMNPTGPIPLVSLASAQLLAGHTEAAYAASRRARSYADRSRFRHFFDNHHCVVCMATGRLDEAVEAAEAAAGAVPTHAAAHRHLLALYAARGDLEGALRERETLERIEPGFTLDRMVRDPDYPVRTLRRTGLLDAARQLL